MTTTKIGAEFCLDFRTRPSALQIVCNGVDDSGVFPAPSVSWYKDRVLAITQDSFGQPSFNEDFLKGIRSLLQPGALSPSPLIAIPAISPGGYGDLFLNFVGLSISNASLLPFGVNASNLDREVFSVLLGRWECQVNNSFGEDSAATRLYECCKLNLSMQFFYSLKHSSSYIKAIITLLAFPHQRKICAEGLLGQHAFCILGRTLAERTYKITSLVPRPIPTHNL